MLNSVQRAALSGSELCFLQPKHGTGSDHFFNSKGVARGAAPARLERVKENLRQGFPCRRKGYGYLDAGHNS